jgi:MerR family transcriptional regulator, aldehyde-responsive regulator
MKMLAKQKEFLLLKLSQLNEHLAYIDYKNKFYQDVLSGKIPYKSDLIKIDDNN